MPLTCGRRFGGHCPDRRPIRADIAETKSRAGRRSIGLPMSWSRFESIANSRTRRASPPLSSGRTATGCSPRRPADRSTTHGLRRVEAASPARRATRRPVARRPPHGGDGAVDSRRGRTRGDGHHGLVELGVGGSLPASDHAGAARHARQVGDLLWSSTTNAGRVTRDSG